MQPVVRTLRSVLLKTTGSNHRNYGPSWRCLHQQGRVLRESRQDRCGRAVQDVWPPLGGRLCGILRSPNLYLNWRLTSNFYANWFPPLAVDLHVWLQRADTLLPFWNPGTKRPTRADDRLRSAITLAHVNAHRALSTTPKPSLNSLLKLVPT